jgi:hypothetical protein
VSYGLAPLFTVCLMLAGAYYFVTGLDLARKQTRAEQVAHVLGHFYKIDVSSADAHLLIDGLPVIITLNDRLEKIRLAEGGPDDVKFRRDSGVLLMPPV